MAEKKKVASKKSTKKQVAVQQEQLVTFHTTSNVSMNIDGKRISGTVFTFPEEVVEARKAVLVESFGSSIIKD